MKRIVCLGLVSWMWLSTLGQQVLFLSTDKTTSLIFPTAVTHVDKGTRAVLAQQVKAVPTVLLVKAATPDFPETNLSVITEDGSLYSFSVCYQKSPSVWVYHLAGQRNELPEQYASMILDNPRSVRGIRVQKGEIRAAIIGIYVKNSVLYYQLCLQNRSPIDYNIAGIRFYIGIKQKQRRKAIQETELNPVASCGNKTLVKAGSTATIVLAFPAHTLPQDKYLSAEILEARGGRHLILKMHNRNLLHAVALPDLK